MSAMGQEQSFQRKLNERPPSGASSGHDNDLIGRKRDGLGETGKVVSFRSALP